MGFTKITNIILYILMGLAVVLSVAFYFTVMSTENDLELDGISGLVLMFTYALLALAAIAAVGFSIYLLISNPKALKATGITLGIGIVLVVLSNVLASDETLTFIREVEGNDTTTLKNSGTGLILTYFLFGLSVVSIIYAEVSKLIKK